MKDEIKMVKFLKDLRKIMHDNGITLGLVSDDTAFLAIKPKEGKEFTIMSSPMEEGIIGEKEIDQMISKLKN